MKLTAEKYIFYCIIVCALLTSHVCSAQVKAGITVNGTKKAAGDTVKICKGAVIFYESSATGVSSSGINWVFNNGSPASYNGFSVSITYNTVGVDKTIQYVSDGTKKDSTFIYVKVSDTYPKAGFTFNPPTTTCGSDAITFTSTSSGQQLQYNWNFGDNTSATVNPAVHSFTSATGNSTRSYPVSLTVTNSDGCANTATNTVQVKEIPDASLGNADVAVHFNDFNGVPTFSRCATLDSYNFSFKNSSTTNSTNTNYVIDWGDASPDSTFATWNTGAIITHTFLKGNTTLTLSITGMNNCVISKNYNIYLGSDPAVDLGKPKDANICQDSSLTFSIDQQVVQSNSAGTFYTFDVSDGSAPLYFPSYDSLPASFSITHTFTKSSCGSITSKNYQNAFEVNLIAHNACSDGSSTVQPIYVSGKTKAAIYFPSGNTTCVNSSISFTDNSVLGGSPPYCNQTSTRVWSVSPTIGAVFNTNDLGLFNSNDHSNWALWSSGTASLNVKFTQTGTYTITLYVSNQSSCTGGLDSVSEIICVRNPPQASFTIAKPDACNDAVMTLQNTSPLGGCTGDLYNWSISTTKAGDCISSPAYSWANSSTSVTASPDVHFTGAGNYNITLTAYAENTGAYGCPASTHTETFVIKTKPQVTIDAIPGACINTAISPTAKVANCYSAIAPTYAWAFPNALPATSAAANPTGIQYSAAGTFPINLAVTNECGTSTAAQSVTVIAQPSADAGNDTSVCSGSTATIGAPAQPGLSYKWSPATGLSDATNANPTINLVYNGLNNDTTYQYVLTAFAGVGCAATDTVNVTVKKSPLLTVNASVPGICAGGSMQLTATGADTYTWSPSTGLNNTTSAVVIANPPVTVTYTVAGFLSNGCSNSKDITVTVNPDAKALFSASKTVGCVEFKLKEVIAVSTFPDQNNTYNWYADNVLIGSNTTGEFPDYSITEAGKKVTIKLLVTSKYGCKADSMQIDFSASVSTKAAFVTDIKKGCGPLSVMISNTSSILDNVQFSWDFGNGNSINTATQPGTIIYNSSPYNNDTTYYITLTANDGCSITKAIDSVFVSPGPRARFGVDSTFGCSPYNFTVTNTSLGAPDIYYWDFGDGVKDTVTSAAPFKHSYTTGMLDTFRIQLIAENKCARDTQFTNIIVSPNPIKPQVNINGSDASGCAPHTVYFNNNTTGATRYEWNFGDNQPPLITTDNQTTVSHTYLQPGNFSIQINITNGCSDTSVYTTATVYEKPMAAFNQNNSALCINDTVKVNATVQNADAYRWDWNDGAISSGVTAAHVYKNAGTYTITLFADRVNGLSIVCSDFAQRTITITGKPNVQITANSNALNCAPFNLIASAPGITDETIKWSVIDSSNNSIINTSTENNFTYLFAQQGTYQVNLNAVNATGCADSNSIKLKIYTKPTAAFTPLAAATCSKDTTINFINTTAYTGSDGVKYSWTVNSQPKGTSENFSYRFTEQNEILPKIFSTALIAKNSIGCSDTATGTVTINATAKAAFNINNSAACVPYYTSINNASQDATRYNWLLNGAPASTDENPFLLINKPSTPYTITLIAQNDFCAPDTAGFTYTTLAKPAASFTLNDTLGCAGSLNIIPTNTTTGAVTYNWSWGDNSANSNSATPTHEYNITGRFLIQLIANDGKCKDTAMHYAAVETKPFTDFAASNTIGCDTVDVQFTNLSTGASTFIWRFNDNIFSTEANPYQRFPPVTMPYSVTLVAVGKYGCRDSAVKPNLITTIPGPHADFTVFPSTIINVPDYTLQFTNTTLDLPNYRYLWDMGDDTRFATRDISNYRYQDTGKYLVRLIVNDVNTNCIDTASVLMEINGIPGWLYVPNAFCPKCIQQELRTFLPKGIGLKTFNMQVFTTWGQLVYQTTSLDSKGAPNAGWDGSDAKGKAIQQDVYIWKITATFLNGTEWKGMKYPYSNAFKREGTITIVK